MSLHLLLPFLAGPRRTRSHRHSLRFQFLLFCHNALLPFEHYLSPPFDLRPLWGTFANYFAKSLHPFVFRRGRVGVEVNDFSVGESDSEALLDEHVALFFLRKSRLASSTLCGNLFLCKSALVINEFGGFRKVDGCARLKC